MEERKGGLLKLIVIYSVLFTFCFYRNMTGILVPFFIFGTLLFFRFFLKKVEMEKVKGAWIYEGLLLVFGISLQFTGSEVLYFLTYVMILSLSLLYFMLYFQKTENHFECSIRKCCCFLVGIMENFFTPVNEWMKERKKTEKAEKSELDAEKTKNKKEIFTGILIAIPLLIFVLVLLSEADVVFSNLMKEVFGKIFNIQLEKIFNISEGIVVMLFLFAFLVCSGVFACLLANREEQEAVKSVSDRTMIPIVYSSMILGIYILFAGIQIYYLFLRKGTIPAGITYASYAREGFFQLLFLCIFNFLFILYGRKKYHEKKPLDLIYLGIIICTYVIIASSAYRMFLYIGSYDLTFLRIFVLWCLAGLLLLFTEIIYFILFKRQFRMQVFLVTTFLIYLSFAFSRPDSIVVKYNFNFQKYDTVKEMEEHTDFYILNDISSDAMKNVLDLNKDLEKDPDYKIGEEAFDQIHTYVDRCVNSKKSTYRNFNFSKYLAKGRAMQQIKDGHFQSASSTLSKNSLFMKKY